MGHKVNPIGLRVGIIRGWDSRWFAVKKDYRDLLAEDIRIRNYIEKNHKSAAIARVEIERFAQRLKVNVHTARPGIIIGRRGAGVEELRKAIETLTKRAPGQVSINVIEVKQPELEAKLVGESIAEQLEKRIAFRRAMKQAVNRAMKAGAKGIRVEVSGRLGGAEIARRERTSQGKVPLHTLKADIDFAVSEAYTTYGRIGVKVWVYRGDVSTEPIKLERRATASVNAQES
jgi:small subunit ribosomal protein S3